MEAVKTKLDEKNLRAMPGRIAGHGLRFSDHVRHAAWNAFRHGCTTTAKAAAYSAVFAIFPALLAAAALVSVLPQMSALRFELSLLFSRVLPADIAPLLENFFINTDHIPQSTGVLVIAGVVGFSGAAGVVATLMEGFRRAYNLPLNVWTHWHRRFRSYLLLFIAIFPLIIASALVVFGHYITLWVLDWTNADARLALIFLANIIRWAVALSATASVFACLYRYGVPKELGWREVYPGAAFATVTWFVATLGFGFYVTRFADYSRVYGSLGTGIVLMVWLFITALSVLCGAELNAELHGKKRHEASPRAAHNI